MAYPWLFPVGLVVCVAGICWLAWWDERRLTAREAREQELDCDVFCALCGECAEHDSGLGCYDSPDRRHLWNGLQPLVLCHDCGEPIDEGEPWCWWGNQSHEDGTRGDRLHRACCHACSPRTVA